MPALKLKEDAGSRLVFQSARLPSIGSLFSMLIWVGVLALFFLPGLGEGQVDWANLATILFFFVITIGGTALATLTSTTITLDRTGGSLTVAQNLLGIPIRSTSLAFRDISEIQYEYYRQSSGRYSHDAWRIVAAAKDGSRVPLNWDGKRDELSALAQRIADMTGVALVDNSNKPVSTVQQILDTIRVPLPGNSGQNNPRDDSATPMPADTNPPPTPAMPEFGSAQDTAAQTLPSEWLNPTDTASQTSPAPDSAAPWSSVATNDTTSQPATVPAVSLRNLSPAQLEQRVAGDPMDSDARYALARKYQERAQFDRAIDMYQQTLRLDPTNSNAQNDLGVALQQRGKRTEAEAALRRAVALDPFSSTAHLNLGLLLRAMKRATDASQEFYLARQNARNAAETRLAESASTGANVGPQLSA